MKNIALICAMGLSLIACGGSGSGTSQDRSAGSTATQATTQRFVVNGTSNPLLPTQPQPIDPYENEGVFSISYDLEANGTVKIEFSVVEEAEGLFFCGSEATEFYQKTCGEGLDCGLVGEVSCEFTPHNQISCEGGAKTDLTSFFEKLPQEAELVMCVRRKNSGHYNAERVEFR